MRLLLAIVMLWMGASIPCYGEVIHREKSLYRNIEVRESHNRRCLVFARKRGDRNQTCMDLRDPNLLVFPYVRMTLAGLLLTPEPAHILIIGLGGGSIPVTLKQLFPESGIDIVEIDEAVLRVAREYFDFRETPSMKVFVSDARVFVKRAHLSGQKYDLIILDAFTGDYIPEHLMTVEFLEEVKHILAPKGAVVANTFSTSRLYDHESVTYQKVFGDFLNFTMPITGNRVIIAGNAPLPAEEVIEKRADHFAPLLKQFGVKIADYPQFLGREPDWDESKRPLTDQYSPANLLRGETR